jgi:hypothetical protein
MEFIVGIAILLLIGHIVFHPLRTLGCLVEALVGAVLVLVALGALGEILIRHP